MSRTENPALGCWELYEIYDLGFATGGWLLRTSVQTAISLLLPISADEDLDIYILEIFKILKYLIKIFKKILHMKNENPG